MAENGPLDNPISTEELESAMKELQNKKAVGPDNISNELLTCKSIQLGKGLLHFCNNILRNGNYPSQWMYTSNIITPIRKAGNINDPQNYRGIAVSDNINKLFTNMLNKRLYKYLEEQNILTPNQNGFRKGRRTENNIFILHTIFQKYVKNEKKIYIFCIY